MSPLSPFLAAQVAVIAQLEGQANRFSDWLYSMSIPGGKAAFAAFCLLGLWTLITGGSLKKIGLGLLAILAVVAFMGAGPGAVQEADDIGRDIGGSINGAPAADASVGGAP